MLRPSTAVCGFTDTALHTIDEDQHLPFSLKPLILVILVNLKPVVMVGHAGRNCMGAASSEGPEKEDDVSGLVREAEEEPIFLCFRLKASLCERQLVEWCRTVRVSREGEFGNRDGFEGRAVSVGGLSVCVSRSDQLSRPIIFKRQIQVHRVLHCYCVV
ncbi:hypothetical protein ACFX2C_005193 [Malus domestica]